MSCDFPYSPEQQPQPGPSVDPDNVSGAGEVYRVNGNNQICNPSISQDQTNFPACMLWLNFSGTLITGGGPAGWDNAANQHDRLTISDTGNVVKWFLMRDVLGVTGEIQDPEWSTHPNYVCCLGQTTADDTWDGIAVRLSDKGFLTFNNGKIDNVATPHIWLPDSTSGGGTASNPTYDEDGFVDRESINDFFGTYNVKIVLAKRESGLTLYFIDYTQASPTAVKLTKPVGREGWKAESPMISPDGNWVTFNAFEQLDFYVSYIQELRADSKPVLLAENASAPHWWTHPDSPSQMYVVYGILPDQYYVKEDLSNPDLQTTGAAGRTVKQRVQLYPGRAQHVAVELVGDPHTIVNLPFKGGLSRDGGYLCTGYAHAYVMKLY